MISLVPAQPIETFGSEITLLLIVEYPKETEQSAFPPGERPAFACQIAHSAGMGPWRRRMILSLPYKPIRQIETLRTMFRL